MDYINVNLPNRPALAGDYDIGNGRFVRVTLEKIGSQAGLVTYEAQAFQLDANGQFVTLPSGAPCRSAGSPHSVIMSALVTRTATMQPGWVKYQIPTQTSISAETLAEGWTIGVGEPTTPGNPGDRYFDSESGLGWEWSIGQLEVFRRGKVDELAQQLVERDLEAAAAAI